MTARTLAIQHPSTVSRRHPALWMALAFGFLIWGCSATAHASHGGMHAQGLHLEEPAALLFSTQAQNPFTPHTPSGGEIALDDGSLHCLLSTALNRDHGAASSAACRLFTLNGFPRNATGTAGWHLFQQELTHGKPKFFESGVRGPEAWELDALTGYLNDIYGVSSMY